MQQLRFIELDEGGRLVLVSDDGTRYAVRVDDRLRSALRRPPPAPASGRPAQGTTPREVQAMIRAGQSAEEVAAATGWDLGRVQRFEGPVLAEREHVVGLAKTASVRAQGRTDGSHTLDRRVRERLQTRGVPPEHISWDAARTEAPGPWVVLVAFTAGGRERRAAWHYDVQDRSVEALDDEARWLSEDEQALPGGLAGHPLLGSPTATDDANDLMATLRERRQRRGSGRRTRRGPEEVAGEPEGEDGRTDGGLVDEVLPLEDFGFDHASMGDPPAAHPRGSAPEEPLPAEEPEEQHAQPDGGLPDGEDADGEAADGEAADGEAADGEATRSAEGEISSTPARRERRRLRIPKLAPAVDASAGQDDEPVGDHPPARREPDEVSFEEFFGTDELEDESGDGPGDTLDAPGDEHDVPDGDADPVEPDVRGDQDDSAGEPPAAQADGEGTDAAGPPASGAKRKGRPSVPSWDDVMFGSGTRRR